MSPGVIESSRTRADHDAFGRRAQAMKNSLTSSVCAVYSIEPTRISDITATSAPAIASAMIDSRVLQEALRPQCQPVWC
jgi:hypothetical protein